MQEFTRITLAIAICVRVVVAGETQDAAGNKQQAIDDFLVVLECWTLHSNGTR
jgi:hypothetical protein